MSSASAAPPPPPPPATEARPGRGTLPVLSAIGFVLLVAGLAYVWQRQEQFMAQPPAVDPAAFAGTQGDVRGLQSQFAQLSQRVSPDLKPLEGRIAALENKPAPPPPPPPPPVDLKPLADRITALENKPAPPAPDVAGAVARGVAPLNQKIDALGQRVDAVAKDGQAMQAAVDAKLAAADTQAQALATKLAAQVEAMQKQLVAVQAASAEQARRDAVALRAQAALTSLESGKPLGDVPGAPPAVTRYAALKPPSEAELRLAFPAAAARAIDASRPNNQALPLGQRILQHAETLVTVRQGDKVVLGTTAAQILGQAQAQMDSGDLAAAVATLNGLDAGAAQAMAPWRAQAEALLAARNALYAMTAPASH
jgi:hypothetical protein